MRISTSPPLLHLCVYVYFVCNFKHITLNQFAYTSIHFNRTVPDNRHMCNPTEKIIKHGKYINMNEFV